MNPAWLSLIFSVVGWIIMVLWNVFKSGKESGVNAAAIADLRTDVQNLSEAISVNKDFQDENYRDFYKEFVQLRVKVAALTRDGNGHRN